MHTIDEIQSSIQNSLSELDFSKEPKELYEAIAYSMRMGGKRLRPALTILACEMFGGDIEDAVNPSMAIELFHNFTLIHDDIMDKAPIRRGMETVYRKWNNDIAILSGDTMFAIAYKYIVKTKAEQVPLIMEIFNNAAVEVCEGQQFDMNYEREGNISISQYIKMIRLKTAVLIAASLKIGAIVGNADIENAELLYKFGENTGIAFQIMDDLLDVYGNTEIFGKTSSGDIKTNKKTYLYLKACELADKKALDKLKYYYSDEFKDTEEKVQKVTEIFNSLNIRQVTLNEIDSYYNKAKNFFEQINVEPQLKTELKSYTDKMMQREK